MWAKIVNNEVMQLSDENPAGLWHPDAIEKNDIPGHWEEIPEHVHIGWRFRDNEWISGGQWHEEWVVDHPTPPPGPPSGKLTVTDTDSTFEKKKLEVYAVTAGEIDSILWEIEGTTYTENKIDVEFDCGDASYEITINLTVTGPGGTATDSKVYVIPALFVPPRAGLMEKDR